MSRAGLGKGRLLAGAATVLAATAVLASSASAGIAGPAPGPGADCQPFLDDVPCLQPFPNNLFTKKANTPTGRRLALPADAMPVNADGAAIDPAQWNRNDGFGPGSMITVHVPGLDTPQAVQNTGAVPLSNISRYRSKHAPVVLIDQKTGKRHPIWVELDSNAATPEETNLLIHPAANLRYRHRYVVALRDLEDASGGSIEAPRWFELLRDGGHLPGELKDQKKRYKGIFRALRNAGIKRDDSLYEAWNFTVASRRDRTARLLKVRDDAFGQLGDSDLADGQVSGNSPSFEVTEVQNFTPAENDRLLRMVTGTFRVPCFLEAQGCPTGSTFHYDSTKRSALPSQIPGNTAQADFICIIPRAAQNAPARISLYGHGLLGDADEVDAGNIQDMASEHNFVFCATDWWGFSEADIGYDVTALQDVNNFPAAVDRMQQGVLNMLLLGRLMINPQGLATSDAFKVGGKSVLDTSNLYYDGNSQGGILGGVTTAVAPDYRRAVLGVPGMNYGGILLQRSSDFTPEFSSVLFGSYQDSSLHPMVLNLMQQLWDRAEANGYAAKMTSSALPDTPKHKVLMHVAYGDFQVSQYAAAVEARTIGARSYRPALDLPARRQDANLFYKVPGIESFPFNGSGIVIWDSGPGFNDPPPLTNTAPQEPQFGEDPHSEPRSTVAARQQKSEFLKPDGRIVDVCDGAPCHTDAFVP
jgi:hypothetical protein